jgi:hypothetical protein
VETQKEREQQGGEKEMGVARIWPKLNPWKIG